MLEIPATLEDLRLNEFDAPDEVCILPASVEQHRYWILDQVDRESTASNMAIAFQLHGVVQDDIVETCVAQLTLRHEALRTTYRMVEHELSQIISDEPLYDFSVSDLTSLPQDEINSEAEKVIFEQGHIHMDLAHGPLFFVRLIHLSPREHYLTCTVHHIACDGWSNGILLRDLAEFYAAFSTGRQPSLSQLPFQFADFSLWQKEWLKSDDAAAALAFWKEQIQLGVAAIDLPTDLPRNARKDGPGHVASQLLPASLHASLKLFCRGHQATMHQVLLAAFQAHLSRYTRQDKFLLGSSIANRTQPGMDDVVGRFANPQVIIADVAGDPTFVQLLDRVIAWSQKAYAHQDLPFSRLMEEFQLDQSGATSQFLQVYFVYQKAFMQPQQAEGLSIVPRPSVSGGVNFDMLVSIVERAEGPRLQIEYNTDLFRHERIGLFIERFIRLLEAVVADDTITVSRLPVLSPQEKATQLAAEPATSLATEAIPSLLRAIDAHAEELAAAPAIITPAIITPAGTTSWSRLVALSQSFAAALHHLGVRPGHHVALRMEPTPESAAAALALLRLDAVALPIPVGTSAAEWTRLLIAVQPPFALSSSTENVPGTVPISFAQLTQAACTAQPAPEPSQPSHPAWAAITLNPDDSFTVHPATEPTSAETLHIAARSLGIGRGDTALLLPATTSADSWVELMLPLAAGAAILYPPQPSTPPQSPQSLLDTHQVRLAFGSPTQWSGLLASGWPGDKRLTIVCRGERTSATVARQLSQSGRLWSLTTTAFGPCIAGLHLVPQGQFTPEWFVAPLPGRHLSVVDAWGRAVPAETLGELAVSTATGPERTGFLARQATGDRCEILGTLTSEVRLYNYRFRLGDLEARLLDHPSVTTARAAVGHASGQPELLVYVVLAPGVADTAEDLRQYLRAGSPAHLATAALSIVPSLPLRLDGSLDLAAIPPPEVVPEASRTNSAEYVPPRDEIETKIVRIWEEVLGVPGIGIRTSFFVLGGYSLMIVRLFARINKAFSTSLPITTIFNAPTVEQLADILRGHRKYSALVPVQKGTTQPPFFLIHSYLLYAGLAPAMGTAYPFFGLTELEVDGIMSIEQRIATYVREIRKAQPRGPYYIGGWCAAGALAVEAARQIIAEGEKIGLLVLFDSWRPGYMEQVTAEQANNRQVTWRTRVRRKSQYHLQRTRKLSTPAKLRYLLALGTHKIKTVRDGFYMRNWAAMQWLFKRFGRPMPDFMNNVSLDTLNSVRLYQAAPVDCRMALLRATDSIVIDGAEPACGWSTVATGGVDVFWAPGSHESMFMEPNLSVVGNMLRGSLERARLASG